MNDSCLQMQISNTLLQKCDPLERDEKRNSGVLSFVMTSS
jgi:hypothetical protein